MAALSDEEVFGTPAPLTDTEIWGTPPEGGKPPPGKISGPTVGPAQRTLGERFQDNFELGRGGSIGGATADFLTTEAAKVPLAQISPTEVAERNRAIEMRGATDPFYKAPGGIPGKIAAGGASLAGQLAGSLSSPESMIGAGKTVLQRVLSNAAIAGLTDAAVQPIQMESGAVEKFDPLRPVAAAAMGGLIQGGFEGGGGAARKAGGLVKRLFTEASEKGAAKADAKAAARAAKPAGPAVFSDAEVWSTPKAPGATTSPASAAAAPAPMEPHTGRMTQAVARQHIMDMAPGAIITSGTRTVEHNAEVGGAANSWHLSGQAADIVPPHGMTLEMFRAQLQARGLPIAELLNEGDHFHWAWGQKGVKGAPSAEGAAPPPPPLTPEQLTDLRAREAKAMGELLGKEPAAPKAPEEMAPPAAPEQGPTAAEPVPGPLGPEPVEGSPAPGKPPADPAADMVASDLVQWRDGGPLGSGWYYKTNPTSKTWEGPHPTSTEAAAHRVDVDLQKSLAAHRGEEFAGITEARPAATTSEPGLANEGTKPPLADDIPIPEKPTTPVEPATPPAIDPTDRALDVLRSGQRINLEQGPTLADAIIKAGGLRDQGGEVGRILGGAGQDRKWKMLRRVKNGMTLDEAAQWAQERGYIGKPDLEERAGIEDLLGALEEEVAGTPRYAKEGNQDAHDLARHVDDLDELLNVLGVDVHGKTNAEIKAEIERYFSGEDPAGAEQVAMLAAGMGEHGGERLAQAVERIAETLATTKGGFRAQRKVRPIPAPAGPVEKVRGPRDLADDLDRATGATVRAGRIGLAGAEGIFNRRSGVIRTKRQHELNVRAHEIGHALEFWKKYAALEAAIKKHGGLLKTFDYDQKLLRRHEGFAEWFRWYVTNPTHADSIAPGFYKDFEAALGHEDPKLLQELRKVQAGYQTFLDAPSAAGAVAAMARPKKGGFARELIQRASDGDPIGAAKMLGQEAYRLTVDSLDPWKRAVDGLLEVREASTGNTAPLHVVANSYKLMRQLPAVAAAGHIDLIHGVHPYHELTPDSVGLADALEKALGKRFRKWDEDAIDQFGAYLAARRLVHEYARYESGKLKQPPDDYRKDWWQQVVDTFEDKNPQWAESAAMVYDWTTALWKKEFDAGFITEAQYLDGLSEHPDYVPLHRDVSDLGQQGGKRGSSTKSAGGVRRFLGSTREYINPIHSLMQHAYDLNARIAKNDSINAMDDLARQAGPDGGRIFERIPNKEIKGQKVHIKDAIEAALKQGNVSWRDEVVLEQALQDLDPDLNPEAVLYRAAEMNERGEAIVYGWRDGQRYAARLPDGKWGRDMVEALTGMTPGQRSALLDLMAWPARLLRAGVTTHPAFFFANTLRDQLMAAINTDVGYVPGYSQLKGFGHELGQGDMSRIYNVVGGEVGGSQTAAEHSANVEANVQGLRKKGYFVRPFTSWEGFAKLTELAETGTRLGVFDAALGKAKKQGLGDWAAAKEAAFEARDLMDFDRHGAGPSMRAAIRIIPFLNAGVQALDKSRRVAGGTFHVPGYLASILGGPKSTPAEEAMARHAMKYVTAVGVLGVAGLALRAAYGDDPEYAEIADYVRDTHWVFRLPGTDHFAVWPKPFDAALLSNIFERTFEAVAYQDPTSWKRLGSGMEAIMIPAHDAPVLALPFQLASHKDAFGQPIVPESKRGREARDQYSDQTSEIAKRIGTALNMSPAQIDHVVKGVTGSWGRDILRGADTVMRPKAPADASLVDMPVFGRFIKDFNRGSVSSKEFWNLVSDGDGKFAQKEASFRGLMNEGKYADAVTRLNAMKPDERAYTMVSVFGEGQLKQVHPMIRSTMASEVIGELTMDIKKGDVRDEHLQPMRISSQERRAAQDLLGRIGTAEKQHALIATGVEGWAHRPPLPKDQYIQELVEKAPHVAHALVLRMSLAGVADPATTYGYWKQLRPQVEAKQTLERLGPLMDEKVLKGKAGAERMLRQVAPVE